MNTRLADQHLLGAADAIYHAPGLSSGHNVADTFERLYGQVDRHAFVDRDNPVDRGLDSQHLAKGSLVVILKEAGQLGIDPADLILIDANDKGQQAESETVRGFLGADKALADHPFQQSLDLCLIPAKAAGNDLWCFLRKA